MSAEPASPAAGSALAPSAPATDPGSPRQVICTRARHLAAIRDILNHNIVTSTALYDYVPRSDAVMQAWFDAKEKGGYPIIGLEDEAGQLLGFASYGAFRAFPAYKYSVEHSVYVAPTAQGKGYARRLMSALIEHARGADIHMLVGVVDAENEASIALHRQLGFVHAGTLRQAGFKFGLWLDVSFYQLTLETPAQPVDG